MANAIDAARAKHVAALTSQSQAVAERERTVASGERPVVSEATFRRVAERAMVGDEAILDPTPRRKPG
jgi:hypothetical protein